MIKRESKPSYKLNENSKPEKLTSLEVKTRSNVRSSSIKSTNKKNKLFLIENRKKENQRVIRAKLRKKKKTRMTIWKIRARLRKNKIRMKKDKNLIQNGKIKKVNYINPGLMKLQESQSNADENGVRESWSLQQ